jgi:two-component system, cell cycle sensor histidine kinase and response regulator CckA
MRPFSRRSTLRVNAVARALPEAAAPGAQELILQGYAPAQMVADLRKYQTELEIQNQALRYSQQEAEGASERFATLFSSVPLALMVVDEEGLVLASNAQALRLFQPLESDPPLNFLLPFVAPEHADEVAVSFLSAKSSGSSEVSEVVFRNGTQGLFTGDLHIARIESPQDELAHFICAIIDQGPLLAQRLALQESAAVLLQRNEDLLQSENRMAAIINSSLDAILCVDEQLRITVFNPAATTLFACPAKDAYGSALERFLPEVHALLQSGGVSSQAVLGEYRARTGRGEEIFVEISVSVEQRLPQGSASGTLTTVFARDLTASKQAEAQRLALETQLRESQKMQAIGTMAGGIAHDFNNILSAILGNVELARQDTDTHSPAHTSLQEIDKAGRRARDLVRQILTFSRNEQPKRIAIDLREVVQETVRLVRVTLPPGVDLSVSEAAGLPHVLADATQVEQALLNLCTNAILAIGSARGSVQIRMAAQVLDGPTAKRMGVEAGDYVALSVQDTGNGMDEATLQRIFEPFFTTRQVGQGTGLGLSVVHGIMQTHLGGIDVQSRPGQGSTFHLYFPASPTRQTAPVAEVSPPSVAHGQGKRVMYVDDDQALVFLVERVLRRRGYVVTTFNEPLLAQEALARNPEGYDLLVTDYNMPGYSGVELLRAAKAIRSSLPVALASGYVTPEMEAEAFASGASALVYKPNDVNELCETVQRLVQGDAPA